MLREIARTYVKAKLLPSYGVWVFDQFRQGVETVRALGKVRQCLPVT